MKNVTFILSILLLILIVSCNDNITTKPDNAGYDSVKIGQQIWMKKNLEVDHYSNGDAILFCKSDSDWYNAYLNKTGAWCYYQNDDSIGKIYGKLYNWYAVGDKRGLAPVGWRIPTDDEWTALSMFLGGEDFVAGKIKESDTTHWKSPNVATNETGFTALPGGYRIGTGPFYSIGMTGHYWTLTEKDSISAWLRYMIHYDERIRTYTGDKFNGFSVRCIKN